MVGLLGITVGAVAVVLFLVVFFVLLGRLNRKTGQSGVVRNSRLTCPKCGRSFDFEYVPFASVTALRLGNGRRYMACPICHQWSTFDLLNAPPASVGSAPAAPPTNGPG